MELRFDNGKSEIKDQFYVGIESIEEVEEGNFQIVFDGIKKNEFEIYGESELRLTYEKVTPHLFFITVRPSFFPSFIGLLQSRIYRSRWFLLETSYAKTDISSQVIIDSSLEQEEQSMFISSISLMRENQMIIRKLNKYFSWDENDIVNPTEIQDHLNKLDYSDLIFKLNVYDVGQGSLSAVTDEYNTPLFYFDLGGGFRFNRDTYPITLGLCIKKAKHVILSHWDFDHVETARRYLYENPRILNGLTWIAPKQDVKPYFRKLAARLVAAGGKLLLWSSYSGIKTIDFWAGQLKKCEGPDKNHSGLVLIVKSPENSIENVLHPGDAAYCWIPGYQNLELNGLVATHHGANFYLNNGSIPQSNIGAIAYSHGNRYGHPTVNSVNDHEVAGWSDKRETFAGKISTGGHISFTKNLKLRKTPLNNNICSIQIFQTF